jgi:hypothetical protein
MAPVRLVVVVRADGGVTARHAILAAYAAIGAALIGVQILAVRRRSLTLGRLIQWLAWRRTGRGLLLLGWAWLGWHLFARGTVAFLR